MRRAAYFQMSPGYFGRGFDEGPLLALRDAGYEVDVFAPGPDSQPSLYPHVRRRSIDGYSRRDLQRVLSRRLWRGYDLFLGTSDLPMTFAAVLATIARKPSVFVCDEIFLGGYRGHAHTYWLPPTRRAMRNAAFTIIPDLVRVPLQREYARIGGRHEFVEYPCSHVEPWGGIGRDEARSRLGIAPGERVVSLTGALRDWNAAHWALDLVHRMPDVKLLLQPGRRSEPVVHRLVERLAREGRVIYCQEVVAYEEAHALTMAADVSLVFYLSEIPQFRLMGFSSQKLCSSLRLGIPVVATEQPSFAFLEEEGCGVLIRSEEELPAAIERVFADRDRYALAASRVWVERVRAKEKMQALVARFAEL